MTVTFKTDLAREIRGALARTCSCAINAKSAPPAAQWRRTLTHTPPGAARLPVRPGRMVLNSRTISVCAACETCSTRCPQGIDIARIMDELEIMAAEQGIASKAPSVPMFYKSANRGINYFGRMWELGLMAELYIRQFLHWQDGKPPLDFRQLFKYNMGTAVKMLRR